MKTVHEGKQALVDFNLELNSVRLTEASENETTGNTLRVIEGVASRGNVINRNNRYYPTAVLQKVSEKLQGDVLEGAFTGELDHPEFSALGTLERTAIRFTKLWVEGDDLMYEGTVLNTPAGNTLLGLLEGGVKVGMSTRGAGTLKTQKLEGVGETRVIQEDFNLFGIDSVKVPSNVAGIARLRESMEENITKALEMSEAPTEGENEVNITDTAQLREHYPELVTALEAAATEAASARVSELEASLAEATTVAQVQESTLAELRTALAAESTEAESSLLETVSALRVEVEVMREQLATERARAERATLDEELNRVFEGLARGHKFENPLRKVITDLSKFESVEALEAEVAHVVELAEAVMESTAVKRSGTAQGRGVVESVSPNPTVESPAGESAVDRILNASQDDMRVLAGSYTS